jgi:aspartyl/asparaginyl-tRNA synthetase
MADQSSKEKSLIINSEHFHYVVNKLRSFFIEKGFIECHTQNRLSILAACEDPSTINSFQYLNEKYPLPQTGQMWLEYELLTNPKNPGYFCVSTSYRNEPNPIPGRHDFIFPMFEFELKGDLQELERMEIELLQYLGYTVQSQESLSTTTSENIYPNMNYEEMANQKGVQDLTHDHEQEMYRDYGPVFFLKNFPEYTSPFWNMKRNSETRTANKIDVILSGMETIGSAERSCDIQDMRNKFYNISSGLYAKTIFNHFTKERVEKELDEFFQHDFITRSGGGIGITRLISSMLKEGLIPEKVVQC